jgi:hypothetical protein
VAREAFAAVSREFGEAQQAYRSRSIGDAEFMAASKRMEAAQRQLDAAEARFHEETKAERRRALEERKAERLTGTTGDLGQGDLLGGSTDLFAPPAPKAKPGLVSDTGAELWADRTIAEGGKRLLTGLDPELFAAYVVKGAAHLERGVRQFAAWSNKMIAEYGDAIRPHLRRIFDEAQAGLTIARRDSQPMRKLAARATASPDVPADQQRAIAADPTAYYQPQAQDTVAQRIGKLSNEELASVPFVQPDGAENIWVASRLELYKRLNAAGQREQAMDVLRDAWQRGTALGQLVNQFKFLRGATPEGVIDMVNQRLTDAQQPPMRPADRIAVRVMADQSIKANENFQNAERQYHEAPGTPENFENVVKARSDAIEADARLQRKIQRLDPVSFWDMMVTLQQGNKITSVSHGRNVLANLSSIWMRAPARGLAALFDTVDAFVRSRPREIAASPSRTIPAAAGAAARALPQSMEILRNGATDFELSKADAHVGLRPLVALSELMAGELKGKPVNYQATRALEASPLSWIPAASLRLLAAADLPRRCGCASSIPRRHSRRRRSASAWRRSCRAFSLMRRRWRASTGRRPGRCSSSRTR